MSNSNVMSEYLVRLGFDPDKVGFARFAGMMRDAGSIVDNEYLRMAKRVVEFEVAGISAFAAVGAGALGFMDHVAMADQEYRLFALRMMTSLPVARELKVALDALGQPLENVMWDSELAGRFQQLIKDQQIMTEQLGPQFEQNMMRIRDVRFELTRLGVELKYLGMNVVNDLTGGHLDDLLQKLDAFNDAFIAAIPAMSRWLSGELKPVLGDVRDILGDTGSLVGQLATDFIHFIGLLGDDSLKNAPLTFGNMAKAIQDVVAGLAHAIEGMLKLSTNLALLFDAGVQATQGNFTAAMADIRKMQPIGKAQDTPTSPLVGAGPGLATKGNVQKAIIELATKMGMPPEYALAVADVESGFRQFDKNGKVLMSPDPHSHAAGIFQLQPKTAALMGVDANDVGGNIQGGLDYLRRQFVRSGGNWEKALEMYHGGTSAARRQYASSVMSKVPFEYHAGDVTYNIYPPTGTDAETIAKEIDKTWRDARSKDFLEIMRNINQSQVVGSVPGQ